MPESITIKGELFSAKNSMQIIPNRSRKPNDRGRSARPYFLVKSRAAKEAEGPIEAQLLQHRNTWRAMTQGASLPLALRFKIYRKTRRRFDYVNCVQSLLDCMTRMKWIEDDDADHVIPIFDQYEVDPANPRVVITIAGSGSEIVLAKTQPTLF
jgi:Holliday junction resolvase RusA-like endonuclease